MLTPSDVLAAMMRDRGDRPAEVRVVMPTVTIRPGEPGVEPAFGEAYAAAGGASRLGQAVGEASAEGPGWVQHFDGGPGGEAAVICAPYNRRAVAVSGTIWNALSTLGDVSRGGGIAGAGLAAEAVPPAAFIGPNSTEIELAGGTWGPGTLVRQDTRGWTWQPRITFDDHAYRDRVHGHLGARKRT